MRAAMEKMGSKLEGMEKKVDAVHDCQVAASSGLAHMLETVGEMDESMQAVIHLSLEALESSISQHSIDYAR